MSLKTFAIFAHILWRVDTNKFLQPLRIQIALELKVFGVLIVLRIEIHCTHAASIYFPWFTILSPHWIVAIHAKRIVTWIWALLR